MTAAPPADASLGLSALCIVPVPLALAGLALINTGLGRARSAAYAMFSSMIVIALATIVFCLWGFSLVGVPGQPAHSFTLGGVSWNWLAHGSWRLHEIGGKASPASLALLFHAFAVSLAALIPISTGAERWRLRACSLSTVLLAAITYPLFAHWVWGGGWLAQLGIQFRLGRGFVDPGGSGVVHAAGGLTALALAWVLGPRRGRYTPDGMPAAIPGHHIVFVLLGCLLLAPGWIGLNSTGAILFAGATVSQTPLIAVNTLLSACSALLAAVLITRVRFGRPDASLSANGWVGGLVASSAGCVFLTPVEAVVAGAVAGALVTVSAELLEVRLSVDDPGGAISVHGVAGIWGLIAVGIFARTPGSTSGQMLAQVVGVATLLGFVLPVTFGLNWLLDRVSPQRVDPGGERLGMDLHELGAGAYPEFSAYNDESNWR